MPFCSNCGTKVSDDARFCPTCGMSTDSTPASTAKPASNALNKMISTIKAKPILLAIPVGVIALAIVLIVVLNPGDKLTGYKKAVDNYVSVCYRAEGDKSAVKELAPKEFWDYYEDSYDADADDLVDDFVDSMKEYKRYVKEEFGQNFKVTYKITDTNKLDEDQMDAIIECLSDTYDISKNKIKNGYNVDLELTIKGNGRDEDAEEAVYVVQIGDAWYVVNGYIDEDGAYLSFMVTSFY